MKGIKMKHGVALLFGCALIAGLAAVAFASGGGGEHGSLSPAKLKDLLWRAMNFAGLVAILLLTLKKPIANGLNSRRQAIMEQFEELEARKNEAEQKYRQYESRLSQIDSEVQQIVAAAVSQGEVEKERIIEEAKRAASDIKRQAEMAIQHEMGEAKRALKNEIADKAAAIAEGLLKEKLDSDDQVRLVKDYLSKVGG